MSIFNIANRFSVADYLNFTANVPNSTIALNKIGTPYEVDLQISTNGIDWSNYTFGDVITLANAGDKIYMRNSSIVSTKFSKDNSANYYNFAMTGSISAGGKVGSLLKMIPENINLTFCCFYRLFYDCTALTTAPELPDTVASYSYSQMFYGCTALTTAPALPATSLQVNCYERMFYNCTSLTVAPALPATAVASYCYYYMFYNCTSLTVAPALPATALASYCYYYMFYKSGITAAPELPATTLSNGCYSCMFSFCTSLTSIPALPATTLKTKCYYQMFYGCNKVELSTTQTGSYVNAYRIPTTGSGVTATDALKDMFNYTGGTFTGTPSINKTYYTSNTII